MKAVSHTETARQTDSSYMPFGKVNNLMEAGAPPLSSTPTAMIFSVGCQAISLPLQRRSNFATHSPVLLSHCKKEEGRRKIRSRISNGLHTITTEGGYVSC